jgi:hypothetical protein
MTVELDKTRAAFQKEIWRVLLFKTTYHLQYSGLSIAPLNNLFKHNVQK